MTLSDEPPFAEPWEAKAFALVVHLHGRGAFTWAEWAQALSGELKRPDAGSYYQCWLLALEHLTLERGVLDRPGLDERRDAWAQAYRNTPHGQPVQLT